MEIIQKTLFEILTADGKEVHPDDIIVIRTGSEDCICRFIGFEKGYFKTKTLDGNTVNQYRPSSIKRLNLLQDWLQYGEDMVVRPMEVQDGNE